MEETIKDVNPNADEIKNLEAQIANIDVTTLDPNDNGKVIAPDVTETKVETQVETQVAATTEDPVKAELDRIKGQTQGKSPKEKFEYKLQREIAQAKEMGIDIAGLAGIKQTEEIDEDKPLTRKDIESILKQGTPTKSAMEMALEIENEAERELHLHYLENKVNQNLPEDEKFRTAKEMVDAIKLKNQVHLTNIKPVAQTHSTSTSVQPLKEQNFDQYKLTPEEDMLFRDAKVRGVSLTKEEIIQMRAK